MRALLIGAVGALVGRALAARLVLFKLRRDLVKLNEGDCGPVLAAFADDAVLHFNEGAHRWSGDHRGKPAIERFLRDFTRAGLQGELDRVWISGPPWALTLVGRFNDEARGPDGEQIYANEAVLVARTRWGKVVEQWDFFRDTVRMGALEQRLQELGIESVAV
ncbi:MAG TPA: nuclear transport factor 2 family protein [Solirubrobacteraceae bacterium]